MANLVFYYGTMESGKTTKLLQDHYNYSRHDINTLVLKPKVDTKGGDSIVSRTGENLKVDYLINKKSSILDISNLNDYKFIMVDEAQFLTKEQINELWLIAHQKNITVLTYGLKNNFKGELFEGSSQLFSRSDEIRELTVSCLCGNVARYNARKINGKYVSDGNEVVIDGAKAKTEYVPLCSDCFLKYVEKKEKELV